MKKFDVIIVGGGIVGATTALAIAKINQSSPLSIALVESVKAESNASPSFDDRAVALSAASVEIYKSLNLWQELKNIAEPITDIHISEQNHFGFTRLSAKDYQLDALGQVIPLNETGPILWDKIKTVKNITTFCPNKIININSIEAQQAAGEVIVELEGDGLQLEGGGLPKESQKESQKAPCISPKKLSASLIIAADGTFSNLAKMMGIKTQRSNYQQHAVIANISTEKPHNNRAFERFTTDGPLALLPLTRNRMSLVWCQNEENLNKRMELNDACFMKELQNYFGFRLGKITKVGERSSYPLSLHLPEESHKGRVLLLGNSAHTLHPIAGQGFNIGLRDIAALVELVEDSLNIGVGVTLERSLNYSSDPNESVSLDVNKNESDCDPEKLKSKHSKLGSSLFLEKYENQRKPDWKQTIGATDTLVRLFSNDFFPLKSVRSKALWMIDKIPFVKNKIANGAMGFAGESARLTRGLK